MTKRFFQFRGFSLVELLIALAVLAIVISVLIPSYLQMRRQAYIRVAKQQALTVEKAIHAWVNTFASVDAASTNYGTTNASILASSFDEVCARYLDSSLRDNLDIATFSTGAETCVSYFTTPEMREITGNNYSIAGVLMGEQSPALNRSTIESETKKTAYAVVYWPASNTNPITRRREFLPCVDVIIPNL